MLEGQKVPHTIRDHPTGGEWVYKPRGISLSCRYPGRPIPPHPPRLRQLQSPHPVSLLIGPGEPTPSPVLASPHHCLQPSYLHRFWGSQSGIGPKNPRFFPRPRSVHVQFRDTGCASHPSPPPIEPSVGPPSSLGPLGRTGQGSSTDVAPGTPGGVPSHPPRATFLDTTKGL